MKRGQTPFARKRGRTSRLQRGVTLIELIASITVIALAGAALMGTLSYLAGTGGSYVRQAQAQSIADAYLAEITGRSFADVAAYNGLNTQEPGGFRVRANLSPGGLGTLPNNAVWRIDVTVDYGASVVVATGYRTNRP
jgi:prepilin-type N-terminal cleavage/methylation domain-containing protein